MDPAVLKGLKDNIFAAAWSAIEDPEDFPWHMNSHNIIDTWQINSSQALAVDVFGSLKMARSSNQILNALAQHIGLSSSVSWNVKLEWTEHGDPLKEKRPSQIDAVAIGENTIILFECKFTELAGPCSQPQLISKGPHRGLKQCNGNYENQCNPVNGVSNRCALTGKGIRYWDYIPEVFDFKAEANHRPCPFKGNWYQVMRNFVMAAALRKQTGKKTALVVIYVDDPRSKMSEWLISETWTTFQQHLRSGAVPFTHWSYSRLLKMMSKADPEDLLWSELSKWVYGKCIKVLERI
jgi:hypothetical protein